MNFLAVFLSVAFFLLPVNVYATGSEQDQNHIVFRVGSTLSAAYPRKVIGTGICKTVRRKILVEGDFIAVDIDKPLDERCVFSTLYLVIDDIVLSGPDRKTLVAEDFRIDNQGNYRWVERNGYIYFRLNPYEKRRLSDIKEFKHVGLFGGGKVGALTDLDMYSVDITKMRRLHSARQIIAARPSTAQLFREFLALGESVIAEELMRRCASDNSSCNFNGVDIPNTPKYWRFCAVGMSFNLNTKKCEGQPVAKSWVESIKHVIQLNATNFEGHNDWRLPTSSDLRDLITYYPVGEFHGKPRVESNRCVLANNIIDLALSRFYDQLNFVGSHYWMAENPDLKAYQNAFAINLVPSFGMFNHGICNIHRQAFESSAFQGEVYPHVALPFMLVRGGDDGGAWSLALTAVNRHSNEIAQRSRENQAAMIQSLDKKAEKALTFFLNP
jgi:hypothetical protein